MSKDDQKSIVSDIAYLRGCFDTIIPELKETNKTLAVLVQSHEEKISNVQKTQKGLITTVTIISTGIGLAVSLFVDFLIKKV